MDEEKAKNSPDTSEKDKTETKKKAAKDEPKVTIEHKTNFQMIKKIISFVISAIVLGILIFIIITIKNALDDTIAIETENSIEYCNDEEACIIIDGKYEEGFVEWNVREYWPFFAISIETNAEYEEGQEVDIVCPVELKTDTFQHVLTKLNFLYTKNNIKECDLVAAE
jgi:hypothetical protein